MPLTFFSFLGREMPYAHLANAKIQEERQPKDSLLSPAGLLVQNLNKTPPAAMMGGGC